MFATNKFSRRAVQYGVRSRSSSTWASAIRSSRERSGLKGPLAAYQTSHLAPRASISPRLLSSSSSSGSSGGGGASPDFVPIALFAAAVGGTYFFYYTVRFPDLFASSQLDNPNGDAPVPPQAPITHHVFFDISVNDRPCGRIVMGLYGTAVPKTVDNFVALCKGDTVASSGHKLSYTGTPFHRIIPDFMCQGGDITSHNGYGGLSIYGPKFADENFALKHTGPGVLSMANSGPNSNSSQFFICVSKTPHLDGRHVVFGTVVRGWETVRLMELTGSKSGRPTKRVVITKAGIMPVTVGESDEGKSIEATAA